MMLRIMIIMSVLVTWAAACPREITFDDLYGLPKCEGARISPDGRQVVFVLKTTDAQKDSSESHLWIMDVSGDGMRQLTYGRAPIGRRGGRRMGRPFISIESDRYGAGLASTD